MAAENFFKGHATEKMVEKISGLKAAGIAAEVICCRLYVISNLHSFIDKKAWFDKINAFRDKSPVVKGRNLIIKIK